MHPPVNIIYSSQLGTLVNAEGHSSKHQPHQTTITPTGACEGCEKGKSKRLPFPPSKSRAKWPLDLIHSDLDKMPVLSFGWYKYTTTYLDDHSLFGVICHLKRRVKNLQHVNSTKFGPNDNSEQLWNASNAIGVENSCQIIKRCTWQKMELNYNCPWQTPCNKMDMQKGFNKPSLMELRPCGIMLAYPTVFGYTE